MAKNKQDLTLTLINAFFYILGFLIISIILSLINMAYENYKLREKRWSVDDYLMEGFENNEKTELSGTSKRLSKGNKDPFTDSYCNIYNIVFNEKAVYKHDVNEIMNKVFKYKRLKSGGKSTKGGLLKDSRTAFVLDAGTGVGRHYELLNKKLKNVVGVDKSNSMIKYAKIRNPTGDFIEGDLIDTELFNINTYDCITCMSDTLYHNKPHNMQNIIKNFNLWLKDNGVLCIHIFDKDNLEAAPMNRSQYYKDKNGIRHSQTKYNNFVHDSFWLKNKNNGINNVKYVEKIIFNNKNSMEIKDKINVLDMYIPRKKEIIKMITDNGFKLVYISDYKKIKVNFYDLYFFRKE
jgi:SAM-dependent methyltransferase